MKIYLQPLGRVSQDILNFLHQSISSIWEVDVMPPQRVPQDAFNPVRGQFDGSLLLRSLQDTEGIILGVTEVDVYVEGLNFIFGLASGNKTLISLKRLRPEFYGAPHNEELFKRRAQKEAMHELGHAIGLDHCPDRRCVMHFSNSIADTDYKSEQHCKHCIAMLSS
jgi:archaemetzincin